MRNILLIITFLSAVTLTFGQTPKDVEASKTRDHVNRLANDEDQLILISLNLVGVPKSTQVKLKDELLSYKNDVISLDYNETNQSINLLHYGSLPTRRIMAILDNYYIEHTVVVSNQKQSKQ